MAGDDDDDGVEEAAIERQLEQHLEEQKDSLAAVNEALPFDPSNPELLTVHEELRLAIKDAEDGLLHLKRARLLKEADTILLRQESESIVPDVKVEPLDTRQVEPEPLELENYSVGSKCRFHHTDGRWYNGHIVGLEGASSSARISFLTPTTESMLMCKFFLQQGCWFGGNCRLSHGFSFPVSSLKQYIPTIWRQSLVGSSIWAVSGDHSGIWRRAELESWDNDLELAQVVFQDDGSSAKLGCDALSLSEYALMSGSDDDNDDDDLSSESSDPAEEGEEPEDDGGPRALGFMEAAALQRGVQTETPVFAEWENHTRGIASKMMASMGYREGMGLGASGQGITVPVSDNVTPPKRSLDHTLASNKTEKGSGSGQAKKRSRGGKRKRHKRFAEAARAVKAEEGRSPDVFSFINNQLAANAPSKLKTGRKDDRRSLVAYDDEVRELRSQVGKLEEMVSRNRKDKAVCEAASRKLGETLKALADAEASHASASNAVASKENEKKWLKF